MTRKEKLYQRLQELTNELAELGENYNLFPAYELRRRKAWLLENDIERLERRRDELKRQRDAEAYFATEKGAEYKARCEAKIGQYKKELVELNEAHIEYLNGWVKKTIGEDWGVQRQWIDSYFEICRYKGGKEIFGSEIEVYTPDYIHKSRFDFSVGTMGSAPIMDGQRREFYLGVGRFLSDKNALEELRKQHDLFNGLKKIALDHREAWEKKLSDPQID